MGENLIVDTGKVLLDREMDAPVVEEIREAVAGAAAAGATELVDLHVWRVGKQFYSCALIVVTDDPALSPARLREELGIPEEIVHSTIEVYDRPDASLQPT